MTPNVFLALIHPGLLALGVALTAVPILIHLLNRRRVQKVPWAAMQWLLAAVKRHQRRIRLENWLILLLRVAAVVLLGLALARPVISDPALAGLVGGKRSVLLVVDTSFSMNASVARTVMEVAQAEANLVLSGLGSEDSIAVVVTNDPRVRGSDGRSPFALVSRTVGEQGLERAKEAVATLKPRDATAPWGEALRLARRQATSEDVNRLVVILTDLQATDWRGDVIDALNDLLALPAAVRIVDVGGASRRNLTVTEIVTPTERDAFLGRPMRLTAVVGNQGSSEVAGAKVSVYVDESPTPARTQILPVLPAADSATGRPGLDSATFDLPGTTFAEPGSHVIRVKVAPPATDAAADALGIDSERSLAVQVRDRVQVVAWTRRSYEAPVSPETFLRGVYERYDTNEEGRRIERNPLYELTAAATESQLAKALRGSMGEDLDLVVLANVSPRESTAEALRAFVHSGGALLVFVGDNPRLQDPAALNDPFHADPNRRLLPFRFDAPERRDPSQDEPPFRFELEKDTGHPLADPFTGEDALTWIRRIPPALWGRMPFRETTGTGAMDPAGEAGTDSVSPGGSVVLRFADGTPAVVAGGLGVGKTLWVGTSLDHGWFERALPFFLPVFLDEAAVYLTRPDDTRRNLEVGQRILVTWLPRDATDVRFVTPGGAEVTPTRYDGVGELDRPTIVQDRVGKIGVWRLRTEREGVAGAKLTREELFAVNPDPTEGRLRRADPAAILRSVRPESDLEILTSWADLDEDASDVHEGEIASVLLWVLFALLILESLLAWLFGREGATSRQPSATAAG